MRLTRIFQERCGDIIGALFAAAAVEPDLAAAVAEGQRRHRDGARLAVSRIADLGGLRADLAPGRAAALIAIATTHEAWRELRHAYGLSWDDAEALVCDMLSRAALTAIPAAARRQSRRKTAAAADRPAPTRLHIQQPHRCGHQRSLSSPAVSLNRSRYRLTCIGWALQAVRVELSGVRAAWLRACAAMLLTLDSCRVLRAGRRVKGRVAPAWRRRRRP